MRELFSQTEHYINEYRATLPDDSAIARAIDRNDSWRRIAVIARNEGHALFAAYLDQAHGNWIEQPSIRAA